MEPHKHSNQFWRWRICIYVYKNLYKHLSHKIRICICSSIAWHVWRNRRCRPRPVTTCHIWWYHCISYRHLMRCHSVNLLVKVEDQCSRLRGQIICHSTHIYFQTIDYKRGGVWSDITSLTIMITRAQTMIWGKFAKAEFLSITQD